MYLTVTRRTGNSWKREEHDMQESMQCNLSYICLSFSSNFLIIQYIIFKDITSNKQHWWTVISDLVLTCNPYSYPAEAGCGGMYEARHDPGDSPQLEGLQAQQAADAEGGPHDWEAGKAAEAWTGKEAQAETSGEPHWTGYRNCYRCGVKA